uniref:RxLR effector protein n=1 Tax=Rhabditophanes sp. KR3021 TaxID=114890 RepID=A0AC35U7S1_9BILA
MTQYNADIFTADNYTNWLSYKNRHYFIENFKELAALQNMDPQTALSSLTTYGLPDDSWQNMHRTKFKSGPNAFMRLALVEKYVIENKDYLPAVFGYLKDKKARIDFWNSKPSNRMLQNSISLRFYSAIGETKLGENEGKYYITVSTAKAKSAKTIIAWW